MRKQDRLVNIKVDETKCVSCKNCIDICPKNIFSSDKDDSKIILKNIDDCIGCLACSKSCPQQAITVINRKIKKFFLARRCNNNCIMCFEHDVNINEEYPKEEILKGFDTLTGQEELIVLSGAEITTRKDILFLLKEIRKRNKSTRIFLPTNGRMFFYERFCDDFMDLELGDVKITVSILGNTPEIHDSITRVKGSFDQAKKGILNLLKREQNIHINVTILKQNYKSLPELCRYLIDKGVNGIQLALVEPNGKAKDDFSRFIPRLSELKPYLKESLEIGEGKVKAKNIPLCIMTPYHEQRFFETQDHLKTKSQKCKDCILNDECSGIWKEYKNIYGTEDLTPIKQDDKTH